MSGRSCSLQREGEGGVRVELPHGSPVTLGRSPSTAVTDPNLSRKQLILTADCENCTLKIKQIGPNPSGVNGFSLQKDKEVIVEDNSRIELLLNQYIFIVKFSQPDNKFIKKDEKLKRKSIFETLPQNKRQKVEEQSDNNNKVNTNDTMRSSTDNSFEKVENGLLYILTTEGVKSSSKIAAYDIDGTLIKTKSGKVFPKDIDDWQIAFPEIPGKLKDYQNNGYKIVLFTNQASISRQRLNPKDFKQKVEKILKRIGVPAQAFISTGHSRFRKPSMGMWDVFINMKNDGIKIDMNESFYCGDAAGRKRDHSFADRFFAENVGLKFSTPEEHFKGQKNSAYEEPSFNPRKLDLDLKNPSIIIDKPEILVCMGYPGSGKSKFSSDLEIQSKGRYVSVCRDSLGTWQKCVSRAELLLKAGKSIIADSTNLDTQSRERWITLARSYKLNCRLILFDLSIPHCKHNNLYRQQTDKHHTIVTDMIYHSFKSKYKEPNTSEGFTEIIKMKFVPNFKDAESKNLYLKHFLEK